MQRCCCSTWSWHFSAQTATICCFIFPFNSLEKLTYLLNCRQLMAVVLFLNDFQLANRCTHKSQCTPRSWCCYCITLFSPVWMRSSCAISSSLCETSNVLLANYPRFFHVYISNGLDLFVSCRPSPVCKPDTALRLLVFPFCALLRILHQVLQ